MDLTSMDLDLLDRALLDRSAQVHDLNSTSMDQNASARTHSNTYGRRYPSMVLDSQSEVDLLRRTWDTDSSSVVLCAPAKRSHRSQLTPVITDPNAQTDLSCYGHEQTVSSNDSVYTPAKLHRSHFTPVSKRHRLLRRSGVTLLICLCCLVLTAEKGHSLSLPLVAAKSGSNQGLILPDCSRKCDRSLCAKVHFAVADGTDSELAPTGAAGVELCRSGTKVLDSCSCCGVCLRLLNETCGGTRERLGVCTQGLACMRIDTKQKGQETLVGFCTEMPTSTSLSHLTEPAMARQPTFVSEPPLAVSTPEKTGSSLHRAFTGITTNDQEDCAQPILSFGCTLPSLDKGCLCREISTCEPVTFQYKDKDACLAELAKLKDRGLAVTGGQATWLDERGPSWQTTTDGMVDLAGCIRHSVIGDSHLMRLLTSINNYHYIN